MVIAVDFDGTIVEHRYPEIGEERPFATEVLRKLIADRHKLILWTVREGQLLQDAVNWCAERGVTFYAINSDSSDMFKEAKSRNISCKLNADIFIDDRNVGGLPDWASIYKIITRGCTYRQLLTKKITEELTEAQPPAPKWMFWKNNGRH